MKEHSYFKVSVYGFRFPSTTNISDFENKKTIWTLWTKFHFSNPICEVYRLRSSSCAAGVPKSFVLCLNWKLLPSFDKKCETLWKSIHITFMNQISLFKPNLWGLQAPVIFLCCWCSKVVRFMLWVKNDIQLCHWKVTSSVWTIFLLRRGAFNNYIDKRRWVGSPKMSSFCQLL